MATQSILKWSLLAAGVVGAAVAMAQGAAPLVPPGPNKLLFPDGYDKGVLYATVDRPDTKQYREFYGPQGAVTAARAGLPIPDGTVLTLAAYAARLDAEGKPLKDANGRFFKDKLAFGPGTLKVSAGQKVTWLNDDDTPHQITLEGGGQARSAVLLKGQSASLQFDAAGNIAYRCGLHPTMKGTIEVAPRS